MIVYRLRAKDEPSHWLLTRCVPAGANELVDHWVGVGVDIDDRELYALTLTPRSLKNLHHLRAIIMRVENMSALRVFRGWLAQLNSLRNSQ
jgi:hypothetical protein